MENHAKTLDESSEIYEKLRTLLSPDAPGFVKLPQHPLTNLLLENLYSPKEAALMVAIFNHTWEEVTLAQASARSRKTLEELQALLLDMAVKGKVQSGENGEVFISAYMPGIFEYYFVAAKDDPEKMSNVARAHYGLMGMAFNPGLKLPINFPHDFDPQSRWRFIPAIEPTLRTIKINEVLESKPEILPFEVVARLLEKYDIFAVAPCACRTMAKMSGNPCKRTHENFCALAGASAEKLIKAGFGRQVDFDEMMTLMKKAETEGLVHSTQNFEEPASYICNCCPCCCGHLKIIKDFRYKGRAAFSNFTPLIDHEKCTRCGTCETICPMEVVSFREEDSQSLIHMDLEFCIGCGICASNCPEDAIDLKKTRNNKPIQAPRKHGFFG
ncbi:MAG: 4Fe-4S binding protein [Proteobacteria bacterium]|nr:4Fe-4S binding protein [Pseudomonadota bacterium]MBU4054547.1 4Fe-4S binding protein [Pseudomonadota bacterium]